MKVPSLWLILWLALPVPCAIAADAGTYSLVEGSARVLRDTTWYKLVPGARFREGDIVAAINVGSYNASMTSMHCLREPSGSICFGDRR